MMGAIIALTSRVGLKGIDAFPPIMANVNKAAAGVIAAKNEF